MEKRENKQQEVSAGMKVCRAVGIVLVLAAITYVIWDVIWGGDFEEKGIVGYVDDFMVFMAAFTFAHGSFRNQSVVTFVGNSTCFPHFLHCSASAGSFCSPSSSSGGRGGHRNASRAMPAGCRQGAMRGRRATRHPLLLWTQGHR